MKKLELEKMLMDPDGLKKMSERAIGIKQKYGEVEAQPVSKIRPVEPLSHEPKPTTDEIKANDLDHIERRNLLANIEHFLPEMTKKGPKEILSVLTSRYHENPSINNQFLLEDAINRLTSQGELDEKSEKIVDEAIKTLGISQKIKGGTKEGVESDIIWSRDSLWSRLYQHSDYRGRSFFVNHRSRSVYRLIRASALNAVSLNEAISSLYVDASATGVGGQVILFQHDRCVGRYATFPTMPGAPSTAAFTPYVGDFINDRTSSILIVRRFNNELPPIALGSLGLRDEIATFAGSVPRISLRGNPIITWDMWPEGPETGSDPHPNAPSKRFIYIKIPVEVDVPNWLDYDAEIRYWIYLYVDSAGTLRGYVDYYGAWVEGGVKHDSILDRIMDALPGTIGTINARLNDALSMAAAFGPFNQQYFLPGTASNSGNTNDDVSLILVRR
jgi:hypothetical protein